MRIKFHHVALMIVVLVIAIGGAGIIAANVQFQPPGVPLGRRAEYEKMLEGLRAREAAAIAGTAAMPVKAAKLICEVPHFDFGTVDPHQSVSHRFEIRNAGDADLVLTSGETSCKCTVGEISEPVVAPGESTEVIVTWNTGYQAESYKQSAILLSNDPKQKEFKLEVSGTVRSDLALTSSSLELPAVTPNEQTKASTYIYSQRWDDFTIENIECDAPGFAWNAEPVDPELLPEGDLGAKSAWKVTLFTTPTTHSGYRAVARLSIASGQGDLASRDVTMVGHTLGVIGFKSPELDVDLGLDLGLMMNDQDREKAVIVQVRNQGNRKIEVLDIKPNQLHATLTPMKQPSSYRLAIRSPSGAKPTVFNLKGSKQEGSRGYVQVGDPDDKEFSNWLPLTGVILDADKHSSK